MLGGVDTRDDESLMNIQMMGRGVIIYSWHLKPDEYHQLISGALVVWMGL